MSSLHCSYRLEDLKRSTLKQASHSKGLHDHLASARMFSAEVLSPHVYSSVSLTPNARREVVSMDCHHLRADCTSAQAATLV